MAHWQVFDGKSAEAWDSELLKFPEANFSQSWDWSLHKEDLGQKPVRLAAYEDGRVRAMAQCFVRRYPLGHALVWIPGGPVGPIELWDESLREAIRKAAGATRVFCRIRPYRMDDAHAAESLKALGWKKASHPLDTGLTIYVPLGTGEPAALAALTPNWRHNLARAQKRNPAIHPWENPSAEEIFALLRETESMKDVPKQYLHSLEQIRSLLKRFRERLLFWRCDDAEGQPIAMRACIAFGGRGYDALAATSSEGRKHYSSYGVLWALLGECRRRGVAEYDMSGIDPREPGVYNFKRGLGGREVAHIGEWDWANARWLRHGTDWLIGRRSGRNGS